MQNAECRMQNEKTFPFFGEGLFCLMNETSGTGEGYRAKPNGVTNTDQPAHALAGGPAAHAWFAELPPTPSGTQWCNEYTPACARIVRGNSPSNSALGQSSGNDTERAQWCIEYIPACARTGWPSYGLIGRRGGICSPSPDRTACCPAPWDSRCTDRPPAPAILPQAPDTQCRIPAGLPLPSVGPEPRPR